MGAGRVACQKQQGAPLCPQPCFRINMPSQDSTPDPVNDVQQWLETTVQLLTGPQGPQSFWRVALASPDSPRIAAGGSLNQVREPWGAAFQPGGLTGIGTPSHTSIKG